jgi:hypothetical protein
MLRFSKHLQRARAIDPVALFRCISPVRSLGEKPDRALSLRAGCYAQERAEPKASPPVRVTPSYALSLAAARDPNGSRRGHLPSGQFKTLAHVFARVTKAANIPIMLTATDKLDGSGIEANPCAVMSKFKSTFVPAGRVFGISTVLKKFRSEHVVSVPARSSTPNPVPVVKQPAQSPDAAHVSMDVPCC